MFRLAGQVWLGVIAVVAFLVVFRSMLSMDIANNLLLLMVLLGYEKFTRVKRE